ncbi:hypothetical protein J2S77_000947 [Alkalibacillus salilacus]|uniref:Uncharacterized protein n=1 Tax=Alkalibacillus salilacus TaxID=284582 RepID=A0ABT9VDD5_9BACI|nr:hypothetical protein [Alkalibacillus salilacus]
MKQKGDKYRPVVKVAKVKKAIPTVVYISGRRYVYDPKNEE